MDNKNQNTGVIFPDDNGKQTPASVTLSRSVVQHTGALSEPSMESTSEPNPPNLAARLVKRADIILVILLVLGSIGLVVKANMSTDDGIKNTVNSRFSTTEIPLEEITDETGVDFGTQSVTINGPLQLNGALVVSPSLQPTDAVAGQIYYDETSNVLAYYNGTQFVPVTGQSAVASVVQSVGTGLNLFGGQLSNSGVLSLQGQTGDVTLSAGNGIGINGTTISNTGVTSLVSGNPTLVITNDAGGNYVLTVNLGGAGVTSLNGLAGVLNVANATGAGNTITIDDASTSVKGIAQFSGTNFTVGSGVVNTVQNINTGATPTFAGVNTNAITPSGTLTVGAANQQLTLQGSAATQLTATGGGFTTTIGFTGAPTGNVTFNFDRATPTGTYTICTTAGNCTGTGGGVSTSGGTTNRLAKFNGAQTITDSTITDDGTNVTTTADLIVQGGELTVGVAGVQGGSLVVAHANGQTTTLQAGASTGDLTFILPTGAGNQYQCLKKDTGDQLIWDNCEGGGGGITTTLQEAYNNSSPAVITLNSSNGGLTVRDNATPIGVNLLAVQNSTGSATYIGVTTSAVTLGSNVDLLLQGATAYISNPQGTTGSEVFGLNASSTANQSVVMGNGATSACANSVAIGYNANFINCGTGGVVIGHSASTNPNSVAIGNSAGAGSNGIAIGNTTVASGTSVAIGRSASSGAQSVAIGDGATTSGVAAVALGHNATANGNGTIAIGLGATSSTSNQLVIGGSGAGAGISHAVIGNGVTNATPLGLRLQATSGSGTNVAGANFDIAAGQSTGSAAGGNIAFQVSGVGSSGGSLNALTTVATFNGTNGAANFINLVNSTQGFNVEDSSGSNIFTVDTSNARIGINLGGSAVPTLDGSGIEMQGGLRFSGGSTSGSFTDQYLTPLGAGIRTKINVVNYNPGAGNTTIATGLISTADNNSTAIATFDARTNANHWPTIAVYSPDESRLLGFSWAGSNTEGRVTTHNAVGLTGSIALQSGDTAGSSTASGAVAVRSGNGVGSNNSTGAISIDAGSPTGSGTAGAITVGVTNASALTLGRSGLSTNNAGTLTLGQLGTTNTATLLCRNSSNIIAACNTTGAGAAFVQGGNSFGATAVLGTNDSNSLTFETNSATQATIAVGGATTFQNSADSANAFRILTLGNVELLGVDTSASIVRMFNQVVINGAGPDSSEGELSFGAGSWIPVISRVDDADVSWFSEDVLSLESAGLQFTTGGSASYMLDGFNGRHTFRAQTDFGYLQFNSSGGTTMFGISDINGDGEATFRNTADSTLGFRVLKGNTVPLFQIDTLNDRVYIGNPSADGDGALLVLDTKDTVGDPTGVNGGMYYNDTTNTFRCYENGAWYDCLSRHKIVLDADVSDSTGDCNSFTDVTGLSFAVASGVTYRFYAHINYTTSATTNGSEWTVNGPTNTFLAFKTSYQGSNTTTDDVLYANTYNAGACTSQTLGNAGALAKIEGSVTPSASGTLQVRMATEHDGQTVTAKAGSTIEWW